MSIRAARDKPYRAEEGRLLERRPGRRYLSEFIGTFALVFAGCGMLILVGEAGTPFPRLPTALAFGAILSVLLYTLRPVTEAHFNPAVTVGLASAGPFAGKHVLPYLLAQGTGAVLASLVHHLALGAAAARAGYGATIPSLTAVGTAGMEGVFTFLLVFVVLATVSEPRGRDGMPGVIVGLLTAAAYLVGGPSHLSINPARSLGPAVLIGGSALVSLPIYLIAPIVGAVLAGLCHRLLVRNAAHVGAAPTDLDEAIAMVPGLSGLDRAQ